MEEAQKQVRAPSHSLVAFVGINLMAGRLMPLCIAPMPFQPVTPCSCVGAMPASDHCHVDDEVDCMAREHCAVEGWRWTDTILDST